MEFPEPCHKILIEGVARLTNYQDISYAESYLTRLSKVLIIENKVGGDGTITAETGRQLALRMSYEDVIRVAQLKSAGDRLDRIRDEVGAKAYEPVVVVDYLKPGIDELCSVLPAKLGWARGLYVRARSPSVLLTTAGSCPCSSALPSGAEAPRGSGGASAVNRAHGTGRLGYVGDSVNAPALPARARAFRRRSGCFFAGLLSAWTGAVACCFGLECAEAHLWRTSRGCLWPARSVCARLDLLFLCSVALSFGQ